MRRAQAAGTSTNSGNADGSGPPRHAMTQGPRPVRRVHSAQAPTASRQGPHVGGPAQRGLGEPVCAGSVGSPANSPCSGPCRRACPQARIEGVGFEGVYPRRSMRCLRLRGAFVPRRRGDAESTTRTRPSRNDDIFRFEIQCSTPSRCAAKSASAITWPRCAASLAGPRAAPDALPRVWPSGTPARHRACRRARPRQVATMCG